MKTATLSPYEQLVTKSLTPAELDLYMFIKEFNAELKGEN